MKTLYAVPWYKCNLNCPHCHVSHREVREDYGRFLKTLKTVDGFDHVVLFGGEPTLYREKFVEIVRTGKINSVSTNLVRYPVNVIENELIPLIKEYNLTIATSWNLKRFTRAEAGIWYENLAKLCQHGVDVTVMITLTEDLLNISPIFMCFYLGRVEGAGVQKFLFEPYIGDVEVHDKADEWLCEVHDYYPGEMTNLLEEKLRDWNCNCDDVHTLEPDGVIRKGCPDLLASGVMNYCVDCIKCEHSDICRPCMLQKTCSYPKKLAKKLGIIK